MAACALFCEEPQVASDAGLVGLPAAEAGAALPASLPEIHSSASCLTSPWTGLMWTSPRSIDWHVLSDTGVISVIGGCSCCSTVTWAICQTLPFIMFEAISKYRGIQHFHQVKIPGLVAGPPLILVILYDMAVLVRVLSTNI